MLKILVAAGTECFVQAKKILQMMLVSGDEPIPETPFLDNSGEELLSKGMEMVRCLISRFISGDVMQQSCR